MKFVINKRCDLMHGLRNAVVNKTFLLMKVQAMTETLHDERIYSGVGPLASNVVYGFRESLLEC